MLQGEREPCRREGGEAGLGPLDERNGSVEVRLEVAPFGGGEPREAVQVEVGDGEGAVVEVADRKCGARDRLLDLELPARAPDERRLARAELALHEDDVPRPQ